MIDLGGKIRTLRKERGLTLGELAQRVSCSPSFISQVERGKVSPSIATLKQIANVLKVNIVDFFLPTDELESVVMGEGERVEISLKRWKAKISLLVKSTQGKRMQPFYTVIKPGGGSLGLYNHEGEEFGIVLKGKLEINLNGTHYLVKENESFYYSSQIPHSWSNPTDEETVVVWVVSPPTW
ncbi:MAG: Cro/Cl family transcriptional regulator [Deltaproteobacteria bacterium]|nr:MAG: Cro/Cl family transcriptional regulator [Deltaproteobacteria bacterium]